MSKMAETKGKILNLLRHKSMSITDLSRELDLSTATISQHLDEMQAAGTIEKIDNEHYKKIKYYKAKEMTNQPIAKYAIGAIVIIAAVAVLLSYGLGGSKPAYVTNSTAPAVVTSNTAYNTTTSTTNNTNSTAPITPGGGAFACPLITYELNGSITGSSGFKLYYLNSSYGQVADYVIAPGTSGKLNITENVTNVMSEPNSTQFDQNRTHFVGLESLNNSIFAAPAGVNATITPQTYNVTEGEQLHSVVSINVSTGANQTSYWMRIDGPCGGGVPPTVVTIGTSPYSGNVPTSRVIYA